MKYRFCHRFFVGLIFAGAFAARANPTGGTVAAGSAGIAGQGTSTVTINQASNTAIINWQTFSIGAGELTKFVQPSSNSAALNRVLGGQTSIIDGTLSANGQIYLLNGNGIVVGPGGVINTAGFTGSTRDISDADFLSGNLHFVGGGSAGIQNLGTINALGGNVVLIGKTVDNAGTINATGTAGLVAGDEVLLAQNNADGSTITVNPVSAPVAAPAQVGVRNTGTVTASRAELKAANGNIYALAIQNEGVVRATTLTRQGGHIYLTSDTGTIVNSGTLDASASTAGSQGGTVLVKSTGGQVVHSGAILARGGQGGAGGNAEISGAQVGFTGTIDLTAPGGTTGNLLLDPATLTVVAGTGGNVTVISQGNDQNGPTSTTIGATTVDNILNNANLTLNADNSVTVASDISWNAATTLKLSTNNTGGSSIAINAAITDSNASGGLTLATANAADPISATGAISVANFILQSGAWVQNVDPVPAAPAGQPANPSTGYSQLPGFTVTNDFEIQGGTFLRTSGGDGSSGNPYQVVDVYGLQGLTGFLGSNANIGLNSTGSTTIDASGTSTWNGGLGFMPIGFTTPNGSSFNSYTGTFGQSGGEIDNLTIDRPSANNVGLFADMAGSFYYVDFSNANITGNTNVGVIAGENDGTIFNAAISGSVNGQYNVGSIAGDNDGDGGAAIQYCYFNGGTVTGTGLVGGQVGVNYGQIESGYSEGTVNGVNEVGGIAGENDGTIDSTTGYASVNGTTMVGGVAGLNASGGTVSADTGNATVTGSDSAAQGNNSAVQSYAVGGLVGENDGSLVGSYTTASSAVSGDTQVGGLVGLNTGTISNTSTAGSFNSGSVTGQETTISGDVGNSDIGGVVGLNIGTVMDSYNIGTVTGGTNVGGVAGENEQASVQNYNVEDDSFHANSFSNQPVLTPAVIQTSYNSGAVATTGSSTSVGGVVGQNDSGATVTTCYNVGSVGSSASTTVGGIVGDNFGSVTSTYNSGAIAGTGSAGLVGADENGASTTDSYWDVITSGQTIATHVSGNVTETNLVPLHLPQAGLSPYLASSYTYLEGSSGGPTLVTGTNGVYAMGTSPDPDGGPAWYIIDGQTRPLLAMEQSSNIQNAHQLQLMAENLSGQYSISLYIDATGTSNAAEVWNSTTGFVPIGMQPDPESGNGPYAFTGSLYGAGEQINGLFIDRPGTNDVGLFGYSDNGSVSNVTMTNATITGDNNVGAVVGVNAGQVSYIQVGTPDSDASVITAASQAVGGVVGLNGTAEGNTGTVGESLNYATVLGGSGVANVGGLVGQNAATGVVTQSINYGAIGSSLSQNVGGLVGLNQGQVDDSYTTAVASVTGAANVGGLVGRNDGTGTLETSYSTTPVTGTASASTGALVGDNEGVARHIYWQTDNANAELPGIGVNNGQATDVAGYTAAQLTDMSHYAQGASPVLWDFSPQNGEGGGVWGVNVYNSGGIVNDGLPVLQWQTPVNTEVSVSTGTVAYGTSPTYVATGNGASNLTTYVNPNSGPTLTLSNPNDVDAGSVHQVTLSGTPIYYGYNVEYVNGALTYDGNGNQSGTTPSVTIVPANLTITAANVTIPSGSALPSFTATYGPFAYGQTPSDLLGTLGFTVSPALRPGVNSYAITPGGQSSSNYNITYVPGTLTITGAVTGSENQQVATVESEITNIITQFGRDPFNGLDPLYFMTIPTVVGMEGDFLGAINDEGKLTDLLYISSTSSLPSLSRLVTPGTGVVTIADGFVIVGNPRTGAAIYLNRNPQGLPGGAIAGLQSVLSPAVYNELRALIYGHY
jgi:filamentous hemagglutinin family protein